MTSAIAVVVMGVVVTGCGIDARAVRLTSEIARADRCTEPFVLTELDTLDLGRTTRYRAQVCERVVYYECIRFGLTHECCYRAPAPPALDMFRFERRDGACTGPGDPGDPGVASHADAAG